MKIALNMGQGDTPSGQDQIRQLGRLIQASREGDWNAKNSLATKFMPLLSSLATKRAKDAAEKAKLVEAGKQGLFKATRKFKKSGHPEKFQVFALDFIERAMDQTRDGGGFFARMFGG